MNSNKISVIIPSFNRYNYLLNAIKSIQNQTYDNYEIIVVNDGSTEDGYQSSELKSMAKIIHIDRNNTPDWGGSRPSVRNYGISEASGDFIAFLDDDDFWLPTKLEHQLSEMKIKKIGFSCTDGYFGYGVYNESKKYSIYNSEHHLKKIKKKYRWTKYFKFSSFPQVWDYDFLKHHNSVVLSSVLVERNLIEQLGGFRGLYRTPYFEHTSDHDCWLGLIQLSNLVYIDEPLFYYDANHGGGKNYEN